MARTVKIGLLGAVFIVVGLLSLERTSSCEEDVYRKIVPIGGILTTTETESGEDVPARNKIMILQRSDCKKCISAVVTDDEGKYATYLSEGRYQVVIRDCGTNKNQNCIAPNQSRLIDVISRGNPQFDFRLTP